jgi:hypothetical protein
MPQPNLTDPAAVQPGNPTAPQASPSQRPPGAAAQQGTRPPKAASAPATATTETPDDLLDMQRLENTDPSRHYRFVRADDRAINRARRLGYEVEKSKEGGVRQVVAGPTAGDGAIRFGDTVLMSCPKEKHASRQRAKLRKTAERIGSVQDKARQQAAQIERLTGHHVTMITDKE